MGTSNSRRNRFRLEDQGVTVFIPSRGTKKNSVSIQIGFVACPASHLLGTKSKAAFV